ncbi:MAG: flagellar biosynthetic protein FliR [Verrucomicrobia bacterium]|nr:flagellar biosynthetic protein FliR [Verrucomicrobiota bacterium]
MPIPDPELLLHAAAIFFRAGTFLLLLPMFGRPVPVTVRTTMAIFLVIFAVPLSSPAPELVLPGHWSGLVLIAVRESFIGFMLGFGVSVIFYICQVAGKFISMQIGLMQSNLFNPLMNEQESVLGTGMTMMSIVLIFILNIHHLIIYAFIRSLTIAPPGVSAFSGASAEQVVGGIGNIFLISTQMAAPLIAVNYIVTLAFAILGRAVPSMNVLILSFGVRVFAGISVLILIFIVMAQFLLSVIHDTPERMLQFLPIR